MRQLNVLFFLIITACSSHSELASKKSFRELSSRKDPESYKMCLENLWLNEFPDTHSIKTNDGYRVYVMNGAKGVILLANIKVSDNGSAISLHEHSVSLLSSKTINETAESCI